MTPQQRTGVALALVIVATIGCGSEGSGNQAPAAGNGGSSATSARSSGGATNDAESGTVQSGGGSSMSTGATSSTLGGGGTPAGGSSSVCTSFATPTTSGAMQSSSLAPANDLNQISGIVASRDNANVIYAQADSGASAIYVMDETGKSLGAISLASVTPVDWEGLSIGVQNGADYLYVADIGDNNASRASIAVYRFVEPAKSSLSTTTAVAVSSIEVAKLVYPSGAHNAEALFVDPKTQDIIIATKDNNSQSIIYRAPNTAFGASDTTTLEQIAQISTGTSGQSNTPVTAGDISPTGDRIILRTLRSILLFPRLSTWAQTFAASPVTLPSAEEKQGEGLTFNSDGTAWLSAGETDATLYKALSTCK